MPLSKVLGPTRYIAIIAVVGLLVTSIATFGWSVARTVLFVGDLFEGKWRSDDQVVSLLKTIDTYLLASSSSSSSSACTNSSSVNSTCRSG